MHLNQFLGDQIYTCSYKKITLDYKQNIFLQN